MASMQTPFSGFTSLYDPSIAVDQAALERQMALAQALRQQSMSPVDTSGRQIGGVAYKVSPLEGLAKALQAYQANQTDATNDQSRLTLMQKTAAAMGPMVSGMMGEGSSASPAPVSEPNGGRPPSVSADAMSSGGFPQPAPTAAPTPTDTQGAKLKRAAMSAMMMGNTELANKLIANYLELTPEQKNMAAKGIDPQRLGTAEVRKTEKEANAPTRLGNSAYATPEGAIMGLPGQVPGAINVQDPNAPGGWRSVPQTGALPAIKSAKTAETLGAKPGYDVKGNPQPFEDPTQIPQATQNRRDVDRRGIIQGELAKEQAQPPSADRDKNIAALQKELAGMPGDGTATVTTRKGGVYAEPPMGAAAGAEAAAKNRQNLMKDDYAALSNDNANAQTVISRLQTIKTLGPQAITGAESDKRDFFNGLLSLGGIKGAKDAKTAGDLIDKNAAQIALAIGAGAQGTDALRALALAANPGRHMTDEAMLKAADSLIAPLQMKQAKTQLLTSHFTAGDAEQYFTKKQVFEKAADPRIWELHNLSQKDQAAYVNSLKPDDAKALLEKRRALIQSGAFQ